MRQRSRESDSDRQRERTRLDVVERSAMVRDLVRVVASEQNDALPDALLDETARIDLERYGQIDPDDDTEIADRLRFLRAQKDEWLGLSKPEVRQALAAEAGIPLDGVSDADQITAIREYAEAKDEQKDGSIAEGVIATIFHRAFGGEYVVARTNNWDDYQHGADMMLVNRATGEVVCAFDDVVEYYESGRKAKKLYAINSKGGTKLEYGITFRDGQLAKERRRNIPAFYLELRPDELDGLVTELAETPGLGQESALQLWTLLDKLRQQANFIIEERHPEHISKKGTYPATIKRSAEAFRDGALAAMIERASELQRATKEGE